MLSRRAVLTASLLYPLVAKPARGHVAARLPNGLSYHLLLRPGLAKAFVQVTYGSGSRHDPRTRQGLAHLLEHAMFRCEAPAQETIDSWFRSRGLEGLADTTQDCTNFYCQTPTRHLKDVLELEAHRMSHLRLGEVPLSDEKRVVIAELAVKSDEFLAEMELVRHCLADTTYAQSLAGEPGHIEVATLSDVRAYHEQHYAPGNAVVVVIADAPLADLERMVQDAFGGVTKQAPEQAAHASWRAPRMNAQATASRPSKLVLSWPGARIWETDLTDYWESWVPSALGSRAQPWSLSYEHTGRQLVVTPLERGSVANQARAVLKRLREHAEKTVSVEQGALKSLELAKRLRLMQPAQLAEVQTYAWLRERTPAPVSGAPAPAWLRALVHTEPEVVLL